MVERDRLAVLELPYEIAAFRNAAFAYLAANREALLGVDAAGVFITPDALIRSGLISTPMLDKNPNGNICVWLTKTHENQWALVTYLGDDGRIYTSDDVRTISDATSNMFKIGDKGMITVNDQTSVDMAMAIGDGCVATKNTIFSVMLVDLHHGDLRL